MNVWPEAMVAAVTKKSGTAVKRLLHFDKIGGIICDVLFGCIADTWSEPARYLCYFIPGSADGIIWFHP